MGESDSNPDSQTETDSQTLHVDGDERSLVRGSYGYKLVKVFETRLTNCILAQGP